MHNGDVKRLAVGIEQKKINCGLIYENYVAQILDNIQTVSRKYHLTDDQYIILMKETSSRMGLPELLDDLESPGILENYSKVAIREAQECMYGERDCNGVDIEDQSDWPKDLADEHAMQHGLL